MLCHTKVLYVKLRVKTYSSCLCLINTIVWDTSSSPSVTKCECQDSLFGPRWLKAKPSKSTACQIKTTTIVIGLKTSAPKRDHLKDFRLKQEHECYEFLQQACITVETYFVHLRLHCWYVGIRMYMCVFDCVCMCTFHSPVVDPCPLACCQPCHDLSAQTNTQRFSCPFCSFNAP